MWRIDQARRRRPDREAQPYIVGRYLGLVGGVIGTPDALTIGLLGPFEVAVAGRPVPLRTGRLRTLLAVLANSAGTVVTVDRLATAVFGTDLPANPRRSMQTYATRLRQALGVPAVETTPAGYVLRVSPEQVDVLRFLGLLTYPPELADTAAERDRLRQALTLWRGMPFQGVDSAWLEEMEAPRLVERYLSAVERRVDLDIAEGRCDDLLDELTELTGQHPLRESLWARVLVVLDRCGRPAEALQRYEVLRRHIVEELGVDPGPQLQQSYADLLAGRPLGVAGGVGSVPVLRLRPVPQQLPADVDSFAGRLAHLKELGSLLGLAADNSRGPLVVAVHGPPGVGKTALAVHWAHRVREQFSDGQLYVDLRGFDPTGTPVPPAEAVQGFLDALGVPQTQIPATLPAQCALYRTLLAGRHVLVVLDNARDGEQVRPLVPGSPSCAVMITSRDQLAGLIAAEGARSLSVDLLSLDEARQLLAVRMGHHRTATEPAAVDEIVHWCGRLPLALAIVAGRAAAHPAFPLASLAGELRRAEGDRLAALTAGEPTADVRTVLSWSYRALSADAARLFRLLACHPGPDVTTSTAASLLAVAPARAQSLLAELARASLVTEAVPGRYAMHDVLRAYAAELAGQHDGEDGRREAMGRVLDHYIATADRASVLIDPSQHLTSMVLRAGVTPDELADRDQALAWFSAEYAVLLAALRQASLARFEIHAWFIAVALWVFLERQGRWSDLVGTESAALEVARALTDREKQASVHHALGIVYRELHRYDDADGQLQLALDLFRQLHHQHGEAMTLASIASILARRGDHLAALACAERARELFSQVGDPVGEADTLNDIGAYHAQLGDFATALSYGERALALQRMAGGRAYEAAIWENLGYVHQRLSHHVDAVECYQRALDLHREFGHRHGEAETLVRLGDAHRSVNHLAVAVTTWGEAQTILESLGHPKAEEVRARLRHIGSDASTEDRLPVRGR
jgi:DNA-binding SARP family transcriptional activator/tetratricopeptide (TPR) repeat protein